ncbi:oxidoreductase, 2OG-Fe(II) oxygenase family [Teratosphaeria destructans]|uniref:Oxidoreductase, 2OG-Fe(II) oxygenase family n=1 Tax=Teratosphaeria destructans TaxID=418781 RepID=A0A9W7VZA0_9PEZI|nr:oxidoreductase, 2OG-Fe(II) oxygenase family [Teratosphaeria destructans]
MYVFASGQTERPPPTMLDCPVDNDKLSKQRSNKRQKMSDGAPVTPPPPPTDAHAKAPEIVKTLYKKYQKADKYTLAGRLDTVDCAKPNHFVQARKNVKLPKDLRKMFEEFVGGFGVPENVVDPQEVYEVKSVPGHPYLSTFRKVGLFIYPNLLPPSVQIALLDRLLHRDLSNPTHQTNVHLHYNVQYPDPTSGGAPDTFFSPGASALQYPPKASHSAIDTRKLLEKKLRWITLGGQYDWTAKQYPPGAPPDFPADLKTLIGKIFPMVPEAAICNLYSPGDTLAVHRDVSEECAQPLVSISLGCDSIFIAGLEDDPKDKAGRIRVAPIKLRSGDAVLMSGEARYAWHGVPKVMADTCPALLSDWPAINTAAHPDGAQRFAAYKGWMKSHRVNLNVRQMFVAQEVEGEEQALSCEKE